MSTVFRELANNKGKIALISAAIGGIYYAAQSFE